MPKGRSRYQDSTSECDEVRTPDGRMFGPTLAEPLLESASPPRRRLYTSAVKIAGICAAVLTLVYALCSAVPSSIVLPAAAAPKYFYGVSMGGWLVMEINPFQRTITSSPDVRPSWMFDQIEAPAELDFVMELRASHDDTYAITTMINHWDGFITDNELEAAAKLGINAVRIPVGYWIADSPVTGSSPLEYGFSPEGFVTGGLNHLKTMLGKLHARGMVAMIDIHSLPCNSACVSDGLNCKAPLAWTPGANVSDIEKCAGGVYPTSRPRVGADGTPLTWGDVALENTAKIADWISALPDHERAAVAGLQIANEPALNSPGFNDAIQTYYAAAVPIARRSLPTTPLILSFLGGQAWGVPAFVKGLVDAGGGRILIDWHWYLNWAAWDHRVMPWDEVHERACTTAAADWEGSVPGMEIFLGEWSLALNHDAYQDLDDPIVRRELRQLYEEQKYIFTTSENVVGSFYWALRMGSGWDPRPTEDFPRGRQVDGTSSARSLRSFPFRVWSLLEMAKDGIATPLNAPPPEGTCALPPMSPPTASPKAA